MMNKKYRKAGNYLPPCMYAKFYNKDVILRSLNKILWYNRKNKKNKTTDGINEVVVVQKFKTWSTYRCLKCKIIIKFSKKSKKK